MDRQVHDFTAASAMAYAQQQRQAATNIQQQQQQQQQQQFGYPPQHQQFPPSVHGGPFLPPHPSLQHFPYHQQFPPHPHPHLVHLQQQQQPPPFPPHLPAHLVPSPFHGGVYDSAPPAPPAPPPSDPELHKRIDKLVEYAAKNGPEFEAMIREKQQDNPEYSFLFGGDGHDYYRYKLWLSTRPPTGPFNPSVPVMRPPPNSMIGSPMNVVSGGSGALMGGPQLHQHPFPPFYDQMQHHPHSQPFVGQGRPDYDQSSQSFKGLSGPLPSDVAMELSNVLISLSGTKESIKGAKIWFMQRSPFAPALAEALRERVFTVDDSERQLHIIYLANDILFDSLQRRINLHDLDNEALAFKPVLGSMLARIYHHPQNKEENQSRLQKILQFWASKEVFDQNTIYELEKEMLGGPTTNYFPGPPKEFSGSLTDPSMISGISQQIHPNISRWQSDVIVNQDHLDKQVSAVPGIAHTLTNQQFIPTSIPTGAYVGSMPIPSSFQPSIQQPPPAGEKLPPYPLFPPGLIPGMVRKMQIGSGVPYSPMSPLDIPTVIPPSTSSPSETLERVSKFFKEIGEANPSEGPMKPSESNNNGEDDDEYGYDREAVVRKGGACIPPPSNLQADPETGTYPDGTVERKPGSTSSGRLGLGATANPNEASQYDDVYSSYRKHRSTNYHTSMSARATTR